MFDNKTRCYGNNWFTYKCNQKSAKFGFICVKTSKHFTKLLTTYDSLLNLFVYLLNCIQLINS